MLETERILLRELKLEDVAGMYALDSDAEVHRYLGNHLIIDISQAQAVVEFVQAQYKTNGIGRWAMIRKSDETFIGWCGLKLNTEECNGHTNYYDLGYRLRKEFWRQGYASEAAKVCRDYAFKNLSLDVLYAAAHIDNIGSNKILQKLGFEHNGTFLYGGEENNWYELGRGKFDT